MTPKPKLQPAPPPEEIYLRIAQGVDRVDVLDKDSLIRDMAQALCDIVDLDPNRKAVNSPEKIARRSLKRVWENIFFGDIETPAVLEGKHQ